MEHRLESHELVLEDEHEELILEVEAVQVILEVESQLQLKEDDVVELS